MTQQAGEAVMALDAARAGLAARDADLAAADGTLFDVIAAAHALAVASIGRIDAIRADIEAVVDYRAADNPAAAHELSRRLVLAQHEVSDIVTESRSASQSKAVVLQQLSDLYCRLAAEPDPQR